MGNKTCKDCKHFVRLTKPVDHVDGICGEENPETQDSGLAYLRDSSFKACPSFHPLKYKGGECVI